mmetsp:Transcript_14163/g.30494  ORF Transcript_14163/g.30494 Transcript_14163/m.30494 type:complete len:318 (+) Transcript_14163:158-1111(+)|eukprot:CAMPEP_0185843824 /NCGR_PEP_ID=MMETSP1354-20130828/212_1 /TAXON_ID=708628 /ORGANISM="Erythrolobus madagascarensis, Strain CCMP3276" /LENGTH=317 /DNA_ID=CAMNT_0028543385 /DNA_START=122 /DNA_END=1075 /DNA_ORIENTATION=-
MLAEQQPAGCGGVKSMAVVPVSAEMALGRSIEGRCGVCFEDAAVVSLKPCDHVMCVQCASHLQTKACPFCRAPVCAVSLDSLGERKLTSLCREREERDELYYQSTLQVVIVGPPGHHKEVLGRKLCEAYRLQNMPHSLRDEHFIAGADRIENSPFAPNAQLHDVKVRFAVVNTLASIADQRPDAVIVCSKLQDNHGYRSMLSVDSYVHKVLPNAARIWTFLATPTNDTSSIDLLREVRKNIASMPSEQRPVSHHVVYPAVRFLRDFTAFSNSVFLEGLHVCSRNGVFSATGSSKSSNGCLKSLLRIRRASRSGVFAG